MSPRKKAGAVATQSVAREKSKLLSEALGAAYSVDVVDDETVRISSRGRQVCSISFEDDIPEPHLTRRT